MDLIIPFNLKPYLKKKYDARLLACYIAGLECRFHLSPNIDFWTLAQQSRQIVSEAIKTFQLPPHNNPELLKNVKENWINNINQQKFTMPCCVSQFGNLEEAYADIDRDYPIESILFPQSQCGMGMALAVHAMTAQQQFYLNFNFSTPALDKKIVGCIADKLLKYLATFRKE